MTKEEFLTLWDESFKKTNPNKNISEQLMDNGVNYDMLVGMMTAYKDVVETLIREVLGD